ncbi:MAG: lipopolysaccharide kinase InaA family protein [Pseudomonadota bacterium]
MSVAGNGERHWLASDVTTTESSVFSSFERIVSLQGEAVNASRMSYLKRVTFDGKVYYVKVYHLAGRYLRRFLGRSRVAAEWQNQRYFESLKVPTARVVAFAETQDRRGAIVTEEVTDSVDLWTLAQQSPHVFNDRRWCAQVIWKLANHTRSLHDAGFIHFDLKWRNILVTKVDPDVRIIDCPLGRRFRKSALLYRRGVIKDLACLDRVARFYVSRSQRLRFFLYYRKHSTLTADDKRLLRAVLRFFRGRR